MDNLEKPVTKIWPRVVCIGSLASKVFDSKKKITHRKPYLGDW